jgi:hypothetical protein
MNTNGHGSGPGNRVKMGTAILAAARAVNTALIKSRLATFSAAHRRYADAQGKVDTADADLRSAQAKVARYDAEEAAAVERLAVALANDGHSRLKPFAAFGGSGPSAVKELPVRERAKAVQQLIAGVQHAPALTARTRQAARAAEQAARGLEAALSNMDQSEASLRDLRFRRDTLGQQWDLALGALRRRTRSAADDGAPGLFSALFGAGRPTRKRSTPAPAPDPAPTPAPAPADTPAVTT